MESSWNETPRWFDHDVIFRTLLRDMWYNVYMLYHREDYGTVRSYFTGTGGKVVKPPMVTKTFFVLFEFKLK